MVNKNFMCLGSYYFNLFQIDQNLIILFKFLEQ
jgi:hypothetical protein